MTGRKSFAENQALAARNIAEANRVSVELLITDADVGMTFLQAAKTSSNPRDKARRVKEALTAYQSILSHLERLHPDARQAQVLQDKLDVLADALIAEGVPLD